MACDQEVLKEVPLFESLNEEETAVLAGQVELKEFHPRQRIYKTGDAGGRGYIMVSGAVSVQTVDEDGQEVIVDQPGPGEFFGFASMLEGTPHQTNAIATETTVCIEVDRHDISVLLERKPMAAMGMLAVLGRQFHAAESLVKRRSSRNPNDVIEQQATFGEHIADAVARFGGSWTFIIVFAIVLAVYTMINTRMKSVAWDPYPFILLNLFLSLVAALQAPVIMMSQNRQDTKDRLRGELDYAVNRRAASDIQGLARKINGLAEKVDDLEELLRRG